MKTTKKVRLVIGAVFTAFIMLVSTLLGVPKALAPEKAQALTINYKTMQFNLLAKFQNSATLTQTQLKQLLSVVGFKGKALQEAWSIAMKESYGRPLAYDGNVRTGDNSWGLFQINMIGAIGYARRSGFGLISNADLLNPVVNAKIAYSMSNAGTDWSAWHGLTQSSTQYWMTKFPSSQAKKREVSCLLTSFNAKKVVPAKPKQKQKQ